jgi:hypothetical protein
LCLINEAADTVVASKDDTCLDFAKHCQPKHCQMDGGYCLINEAADTVVASKDDTCLDFHAGAF